jgi:hypothetical protein
MLCNCALYAVQLCDICSHVTRVDSLLCNAVKCGAIMLCMRDARTQRARECRHVSMRTNASSIDMYNNDVGQESAIHL